MKNLLKPISNHPGLGPHLEKMQFKEGREPGELNRGPGKSLPGEIVISVMGSTLIKSGSRNIITRRNRHLGGGVNIN